MKFIDFFAGVGGFRRGMEMAGHKCVGFCEFDKHAVMSYTSMHLITEEQRNYLSTLTINERKREILKDEYRNEEWYSDDIRNVRGENIPSSDCWCFGAPCQDFSVAGKRAGLDGNRSGLVREVFRVLGEIREEDRPEWLIYENVKGMLSSNRGFDFLAILLEMDELGYDCEWFLFNSKYHGVPQNRERVYLVGHLRSCGSRKIFPLEGTDGENNLSINIIGHRETYRRNTQVFDPNGITETLDTCQGGGRGHYTIVGISPDDLNTNHLYNQRGTVHSPTGVARTINASHSGNEPKIAIPLTASGVIDTQGRLNKKCKINETCPTLRAETHGNLPSVVIPVLTPERGEKRQNGRRFKDNGEEAFTLTSQDRHGVAIGINMSGDCATESESNVARCLNANDQRKVFGANQMRTMAAVLIEGDPNAHEGIYVQLPNATVYAIWYPKYECYIAIRRLTPRECFRLQGWDDEYFERAEFVNSDSQLYKQAGNGVTVNVVYEIAKRIGGGDSTTD